MFLKSDNQLKKTAEMSDKQMIAWLQKRLQLLEVRARNLENINQDLQRLSSLDSLTGVANRRYFEKSLELEWRRLNRIGAALSLLMVDIDFFKPFNDLNGHQQGDVCLILVANALRNLLKRPGDMVARYGGDEFILILPGTDEQGAARVSEVICATIEALQILHKASSVHKVLTISVGGATVYPTRGFYPQELIAAADEALYRAKQQGRNQAISYVGSIKKFENHSPVSR